MIAILGDTHVPGRARHIPEPLMKELKRLKPERILFTGDAIIPAVIEDLSRIAPVSNVRGNMDTMEGPKEDIIDECGRILLTHGTGITPRGDHEQLQTLAVARKCKVIATGHTHKPDVWMGPRAIVLNPGSATGVWGGAGDEHPASILTLETNQKLLRVTLLSLVGPELKTQSWNLDLSSLY